MIREYPNRLRMLMLAAVLVGTGVAPLNAQEVKIGLVDLQRVLVESERGQEVLSKLKAERDAKQKEIDAKEKEIRQMEADLEKQRSVLSESARRERERVIRKRQRNLRRTVDDMNRDFTEEERDLRDQLIKEIAEVVRNYGRENGYVLIMEIRAGGVMYGSEEADLSKKLVAAYDASVNAKKK